MQPAYAHEAGLIERYLPEYTFAHRYTMVVANGDIGTVYDIARDVDLSKSRIIPLLFRLRGLPDGQLRARAFCAAMGWTELAQSRPAEFMIAYWRSHRTERIASPAQFLGPIPGATQKVAFTFRFRQLDRQRVEVDTETRVQCIGLRSKLAFWCYWVVIKPFSGLVRKEILRIIKRDAEACAVRGEAP